MSRTSSIDRLLRPCWPDGLMADYPVQVLCDDKGRNGGSWLGVMVDSQGDVYVSMQDWEEVPSGEPSTMPCVRIRTTNGGGQNVRTRQALLYLAAAIKADNEEQGRNQFGMREQAKEQA